ncbi:MAG: autotransporter outer membrane beta-barrel domain-containing protein [Desulfobulbus sp.]|nr:autotransporter outer membrane beta-barrel domain-containing protein [Desulfobulbus sp.]
MNYGFYRRPSMNETGGGATRLQLEAESFNSLRSSLGGQVKTQKRLDDDLKLKAGLSAQWVHEMLDIGGGTASCVGYGSNDFSAHHPIADRDALALNASLTAILTDSALSLHACPSGHRTFPRPQRLG